MPTRMSQVLTGQAVKKPTTSRSGPGTSRQGYPSRRVAGKNTKVIGDIQPNRPISNAVTGPSAVHIIKAANLVRYKRGSYPAQGTSDDCVQRHRPSAP